MVGGDNTLYCTEHNQEIWWRGKYIICEKYFSVGKYLLLLIVLVSIQVLVLLILAILY